MKEPFFKIYCHQQGEPCCVHVSSDVDGVFWWLDLILGKATQGKFSFMGELNEIQCACNDEKMDRFPTKTEIPFKIINLVLKPYGFWVKKELK